MSKEFEEFAKEFFEELWPYFDERLRRLSAASAAKKLGRGGISKISEITKISEETIRKGIRELEDP